MRAYDLDVDQYGKRDNLVCEGVVVRLKTAEHNLKFDWLLATDRVGHESDFRDDPGHWAHRGLATRGGDPPALAPTTSRFG